MPFLFSASSPEVSTVLWFSRCGNMDRKGFMNRSPPKSSPAARYILVELSNPIARRIRPTCRKKVQKIIWERVATNLLFWDYTNFYLYHGSRHSFSQRLARLAFYLVPVLISVETKQQAYLYLTLRYCLNIWERMRKRDCTRLSKTERWD